MRIPEIDIESYNYQLPSDRIAKYPLQDRDQSRLLIYRSSTIGHTSFSKISDFLPSNSLLVFNNTRVIRARLIFFKTTGAKIEIFCLEPFQPSDTAMAFQKNYSVEWVCLVGNLKKWKSGDLYSTINTKNGDATIYATLQKKINENVIIKFYWTNPSLTFADILENMGQTPIPPYLEREAEELDKERYQTIYSKLNGSVAAPTAGLHFSKQVLRKIDQCNHPRLELTLHIGAGTFQPVKSKYIGEHHMHTEQFEVSTDALYRILNHKGPVISVGTTSLRTLESLYIAGVKLTKGHTPERIEQWDGFTCSSDLTLKQSLETLINHLDKNNLNRFRASTTVMIAPGYQFRVIDGLITNFHQPKSTLLLLIAALIGNSWTEVYDYALKNQFRFLSYGDSSLLLPGSFTG